jgi:predicted dehydrogenase
MAEAAFAAGKDVLCEAPLAPSVDDGLAMASAASGRLAVVDMQSRFRAGLVELRRLVRDGYVGRVDNVLAQALYPTFTMPAAVAGAGWCADASAGASSLRVHGLHTVDVLRWTFGELTDVRGVVATREPTWPGPDGPLPASSADSSALTARTADGAVVSLHTSWVARFGAGWRLAVHGSEGALLAEAGGHTGHFPVRLSGARAGDDGLRELVPATGGRHRALRGTGTRARGGAARRRADVRGRSRGAPRRAGGGEDIMTVTDETIVLRTFADAKDAYRAKDLRQSLYDEGEVVMDGVLVNLHGDAHRDRRRVENRMFRRDVFDRYERELFPGVTERTVAPHLAAGRADLVHLGHELMLNLAALTAGIDRPRGTAAETARLGDYNAQFIRGATLAHSTGDKDAQRAATAQALLDWDAEFLAPSIARRLDRDDAPDDVLSTLLRHRDELGLTAEVIRREIAFFLLAGAHTSATAFVRSIDHILGWLEAHPRTRPPSATTRCSCSAACTRPSGSTRRARPGAGAHWPR